MEEQPELEAWSAGDQPNCEQSAAQVLHGFRSVASGIFKVMAVAVTDDEYLVKIAINLETPPGLLYELHRTRLAIAGNQDYICLIDTVPLAEPAQVIWLRLLALADDENCGEPRACSLLAVQSPNLPQ